MPDPIFSDPLLAALYDTFDGPRADLDLYLGLIERLGAVRVLDVGCGTGVLACVLAVRGHVVVAMDPAPASLEIARKRPGAREVTWIVGGAADAPEIGADVVTMTGNVAQVFLTDEGWGETLTALRRAIRPGGHLLLETRRPTARIWDVWAASAAAVVHEVPGIGAVEQRFELLDVALPLVSFRFSYVFGDGQVRTSDSTLRFRSEAEVADDLATRGFEVVDVLDAPDRPGQELVFVARTPG